MTEITLVSISGDIIITIKGRDDLDCVFKANVLLGTGWPAQFKPNDTITRAWIESLEKFLQSL